MTKNSDMKAVVIGFGGMGCRHASSLMNGSQFSEIWILEPNETIFQDNCKRIDIDASRFQYVKNISSLPADIDFAVIATTSIPRYNIFDYLVQEKKVRTFLLEKVVFQSKQQFDDAIGLIKKYNVKAYCNFVNRYFPNYKLIKQQIDNSSTIKMVVSGGEFGLGCNSLHYIDLFQYLTSSTPALKQFKLVENNNKHKRGNHFKEILGQMRWQTNNGDVLVINSLLEKSNEVEISILNNENIDILNESTLMHFSSNPLKGIGVEKFEILYTSYLTNEIFKDIRLEQCLLPLVEETMFMHCELFNSVNETLGMHANENSPIT